ncbi:MAG: hypothetical protein Q7S16_03965 [bacterium]|nr:hypothetical protein [bacterium]
MSKHNVIMGGLIAAAALTLLYAVEGYLVGIFSGAPSVPLQRLMGAYWYLWLVIANLLVGVVLSFFYTIFGRGIHGSHGMRGIKYGLGVWAVATVFYPPLLYANVSLPLWLMSGWVIGSLVNLLVLGYIFGLLVDIRE